VTSVIVQHTPDRAAYRLPFHVRVPARASADLLERQRNWSLERMRTELARQGWDFLSLSSERPRGPFPVVPVKGVGKRPATGPKTPLARDDSLWRVSTLPTFGPVAPHLLTDEVEWEYIAVFQRPIIPTASESPELEEHA
jgi:hypothetical protein